MKRIPALLATAAMAMSLGACTYETQRDTLTGAIAGTAVGLGLAAIGDGDAVSNMARGAAIGALAGASRGIAEEIADQVYAPPGAQSGQGYDPRYDQGYGEPVYAPQVYGQPGYGQQAPVYYDAYGRPVHDPYGQQYAQGYGNPNPYYGAGSVRSGYYPRY